MKVKRIVECSPWSILQYFWPTLCDNWSWKPIFCLFERIPRSIFYGVDNLQLIRFATVCSNVLTWTTEKVWQYRLHSEIIVNYNLVLYLFCYRPFEGQYLILYKITVGNPSWPDQFKKITKSYMRTGYDRDIIQQSEYRVINPNSV